MNIGSVINVYNIPSPARAMVVHVETKGGCMYLKVYAINRSRNFSACALSRGHVIGKLTKNLAIHTTMHLCFHSFTTTKQNIPLTIHCHPLKANERGYVVNHYGLM